MLALLRYHYRDPDIAKRTEQQLLQLFAELQWVRQKELEQDEARIKKLHGTAH